MKPVRAAFHSWPDAWLVPAIRPVWVFRHEVMPRVDLPRHDQVVPPAEAVGLGGEAELLPPQLGEDHALGRSPLDVATSELEGVVLVPVRVETGFPPLRLGSHHLLRDLGSGELETTKEEIFFLSHQGCPADGREQAPPLGLGCHQRAVRVVDGEVGGLREEIHRPGVCEDQTPLKHEAQLATGLTDVLGSVVHFLLSERERETATLGCPSFFLRQRDTNDGQCRKWCIVEQGGGDQPLTLGAQRPARSRQVIENCC